MTLVDGLGLEDVPREVAKLEAAGVLTAVRWQELFAYPPRLFRDAYELGDGVCVCNMQKARRLRVDAIRAARTPVFVTLDHDWMRAVGQKLPAQADAIEAKRQALRDLPQTYAAQIGDAKTPEELAAVKPAELEPAPS